MSRDEAEIRREIADVAARVDAIYKAAEGDPDWDEYESLQDRLDALYDELDEVVPERKQRNEQSTTTNESLRLAELHNRLAEIADQQTAAIRAWNEKPTPDRLPAFEQTIERLHDEYERVHAEVLELTSKLTGETG
ncbi:MAG: hypothetical protein KDA92_02610 [Planctomycetales bacterium]|nr:hypothetical protein [Planctomycetales bacterium]